MASSLLITIPSPVAAAARVLDASSDLPETRGRAAAAGLGWRKEKKKGEWRRGARREKYK